MKFFISESKTSIHELNQVLREANRLSDEIFCENENVFQFVIKIIDYQRDILCKKLKVCKDKEKENNE
jgi:hypothetical protein